MEPTPVEVGGYIINTTVVGVKEHTRAKWVSGFGKEARFMEESLGWFLHLDGSYEALHVGPDKPSFRVGDKVQISIVKVPSDKAT